MSEQVLVNPGQGTGDQQAVDTQQDVAVTTQPSVETSSTPQTQQPQQEVDVVALQNAIRQRDEELKRRDDYINFIKKANEQRAASSPREMIQLDPGDVPIVSEVEQLVEYKLAEKEAMLEEQRITEGLRQYGERARTEDPNFQSRMMLAEEMLRYNEWDAQRFMQERTVEGKVRMLEILAAMHPNYNPTLAKGTAQPASPATPAVDQAIEKMKQNLSMPQTVTGMGGSAPSVKLVSQMSHEEYLRYLDSVKKQA